MGVVTMWFGYYSPVNDCKSRTIQRLPAGRGDAISCATDFTDVEGPEGTGGTSTIMIVHGSSSTSHLSSNQSLCADAAGLNV